MTLQWLVQLADGDSYGPVTDAPPKLASAVERLARGEVTAAGRDLVEVHGEAVRSRDGASALTALALGGLSRIWTMNLFPGGVGAGSVELEGRWDLRQELAQLHAKAKEARALPGAGDGRSAWAWLQFLGNLPAGRAILRAGRAHPHGNMLLAVQLQMLEGAEYTAEKLGPSAVAFVKRCAAEFLAIGGSVEAAEERLDQASDAYRAASDLAGVASCLALRADWLLAPLSSAMVRNLEIAEAASATSELIWTVEGQEGRWNLEAARQGEELLEQAFALYADARSDEGCGCIRLRQAYVAGRQGDTKRQLDLVEDVVGRFWTTGGLQLQLGRACLCLARLDAGRRPAEIEVAREIGVWGKGPGSFSYALGLGLLFTRAGRIALMREADYERAEACFELAFALNRALGADCRAAQTRADMASIHRALGNRARARMLVEEALDLLSGESLSATAAQWPALLMQQLYMDALEYRDPAGMRRALQRRAVVAGDGPAAAAVAGLLAETEAQASVLIALYEAVEHRSLGRNADADECFAQALEAAERAGPPNGAWLRGSVRSMRRGEGDQSESVREFEDYLTQGGAAAGLGGQLLDVFEGMSPEHAALERGLAARRTAEQAFGFMVRAGDYQRARRYLRRLEELHAAASPTSADWWVEDEQPWRQLSNIGEMYEGLGDFSAAADHYRKGIRELEHRRALLSRDELKTALSGGSGAQHLYFQATRVLLRLAERSAGSDRVDTYNAAFEISERGRARGLLDLLATNALGQNAAGGQDDIGLRRWRELQAQGQLGAGLLAEARKQTPPATDRIDELTAKLRRNEQDLRKLTRQIARKNPDVGSLVDAEADVATVEEVAGSLDSDTAVLQYMTLGEQLLVWAVSSKGIENPRIIECRAAELAARARMVRESCERGSAIGRFEDDLGWLSQRLLDPVRPTVEAHERLVIVPYGELHRFPFGTLRWDGDWLGAKRTLSFLPSASLMTLLRPSAATEASSALAVGNPAEMSHEPPFGERAELKALPFAEVEAQRVAQLYGTKALIGPAATLDKVRAELSQHRILHFASHGILYEDAPLQSGIALARGKLLTVQQLMGRRLDADLVVVSACSSGLGEYSRGEEVVGLTRGLLASGARSVLVSLWPIFDGSTATLMTEFFEQLRAGKDPARALRLAQDAMRKLGTEDIARDLSRDTGPSSTEIEKSGAHPQHWAPFIFVGTSRRTQR